MTIGVAIMRAGSGPERAPVKKREVTFIPFEERVDGYQVGCPRDDESEGLSPVGGLCCKVFYRRGGDKAFEGNLRSSLGGNLVLLDLHLSCVYCRKIGTEEEGGPEGVFCDYSQPAEDTK